MDSNAIESFAVSAVRDSIFKSPYLSPVINQGDKEVSWDGNIYVYERKNKTKGTLLGKLPVQVKGRNTNDLSKSNITYSMSLEDLNNYLKDGGVILFVVYISDSYERKVYYSALPPVKLRHIIAEAKQQNTKVVDLEELPSNIDELTTKIMNCLRNCQMQSSISDCQLKTLEEYGKEGILESIKIPLLGTGITDMKRALVSNEVYIYAQIKGSPILHPVDVIPVNIVTKEILSMSISVNERVYYTNIACFKTKSSSAFQIGDSFKISFIDVSGKCTINYTNSNKLRVLAKDLEFFLDVLENKYFEIDGVRFHLSGISTKSSFDLDRAKEKLLLAQKSVEALDSLNCKKDLPLNNLTEADYKNLDRLISAFVNNENIVGLSQDVPQVVNIPVGPLKFTIFTIKQDDGTYSFTDFFNMKLYMGYTTNDGREIATSIYSVFKAKDIIEISNMHLDLMLLSFQELDNKEKYSNANLFMLELIKAYDLSNDSRTDVLDVAMEFAKWLETEANSELEPIINRLNSLQIIRRQRLLSEEEQTYLWNLVYSENINSEFKFASLLLLDQQIPAHNIYNSWSEEKQIEYSDFPIFRFYK